MLVSAASEGRCTKSSMSTCQVHSHADFRFSNPNLQPWRQAFTSCVATKAVHPNKWVFQVNPANAMSTTQLMILSCILRILFERFLIVLGVQGDFCYSCTRGSLTTAPTTELHCRAGVSLRRFTPCHMPSNRSSIGSATYNYVR